MVQRWQVGLWVILPLFCLIGDVHAGGLYLFEIGSPDVGVANAGYAARAQDASTAFTNPAGMTRLEKPEILLGAQPMYLNLEFSSDANTTATGPDGDSDAWMPAGGLFYVQPVNDKLWLGLAVTGYFGLALDYQDGWVGRYYLKEGVLQAAAIQPAVAWKFNERFSVGLGVAAIYGVLDEKVAVNNVLDALPDGELEYSDEDWSVQFNFGLLFEPWDGTRFGITYLSEADLDFSDRAEFNDLGPSLEAIFSSGGLLNSKLDLGMKMPQAVMFSVYHECTDRLALLANLGWQDWSKFGKVDVSVDTDTITSLTTDLDYKDTWHVALGAHYRISKPWLLSAGLAYDSAMMDEEDITPSLPSGEVWRFALGSRYSWSENLAFGAAYELAWSGDLDMDVERGPLAGRVSGTYENTALHFVSLNMKWTF
ncbi:MAG: transporter [Deltaproteobacteria bacterium]|nr:transporter [Deltaproteobacteria bacterium]